MNAVTLCKPYIWEEPGVVLHTDITWKSRRGGCASELTNHIVVVFLVAVGAGLLSSYVQKHSAAFLGALVVATIYCTPALMALARLRATREAFQNEKGGAKPANPEGIYDVIGSGAPTEPTNRNPFMNVLIDEIKYNPGRGTAISVTDPSAKVQLDDFFRTEFTSDPTDVFGKSQSQRQFITMPSTSIPNDQGSFQNWLYKIPGKTCKEGGPCLPGTDGGALPWLNVDR
jgi:hypothetical protein